MAIKVIVVDDSAFMRKIISDSLAELSDIQVVGTARDGDSLFSMLRAATPDLITLDVEMPKMNGLEILRRIKENYDIPVIMLSSSNNPAITIQALDLGALDFIEKPTNINAHRRDLVENLNYKIKEFFINEGNFKEIPLRSMKNSKASHSRSFKAVVIGSSTGGPKALVSIIGRLSGSVNVPIFITQHMPKGFTTSLAERMNKESKLRVVEAKDGMSVSPGVVYLAPGDYHMTIEGDRISLNNNDKLHGVRPAVDYLFDSAAKVYGSDLMGIILTGMGKDGSNGMNSISKKGGFNIAQDKESSVVYGMPGSAISLGVIDEVLTLDEIVNKINLLTR